MASTAQQQRSASTGDDFDPSNAAAFRLMVHILQKGFQAGSVLGAGVVAPAQAVLQRVRHQQALDYARAAATAGRTHAIVFGMTGVLGALRTSQLDKDGLEDRSYRLYYNEGQNRTDDFALVGALCGLAAGALLLRNTANRRLIHYVGAMSAGTASGVLAHVISSPKEERIRAGV